MLRGRCALLAIVGLTAQLVWASSAMAVRFDYITDTGEMGFLEIAGPGVPGTSWSTDDLVDFLIRLPGAELRPDPPFAVLTGPTPLFFGQENPFGSDTGNDLRGLLFVGVSVGPFEIYRASWVGSPPFDPSSGEDPGNPPFGGGALTWSRTGAPSLAVPEPLAVWQFAVALAVVRLARPRAWRKRESNQGPSLVE